MLAVAYARRLRKAPRGIIDAPALFEVLRNGAVHDRAVDSRAVFLHEPRYGHHAGAERHVKGDACFNIRRAEDPRAATVREVDFAGGVLDEGGGDVGGCVADAEDYNVLIFEGGEVAGVGGVEDTAFEGRLEGEGEVFGLDETAVRGVSGGIWAWKNGDAYPVAHTTLSND